jgi:uncharacterized membrane protein
MSKRHSQLLLWILIILFSFIYSLYSITRHLKIGTGIFDLGYYDQLIWLASRFKPLISSPIGGVPWTDHLSISIYLLTPLYWIWSNPIMLLLFQSIFVSLGAYPLYKMAIKKTKHQIFALTLSFAFLTFYGIQNALTFDFHAVTLGSALLLWVFYYYEEKKYFRFWLSLIIFAGLQENFLILSGAFGSFLVIHYRDWKRGLIIMISSALIFASMIWFIIPHFFGNYFYTPRNFSNMSIFDLIKDLYTPSSKIDVVIYSFIAFGLLPILTPTIFIILIEEFFGRFIMTTNWTWWILGFHYNAILAPIMSFAAINSTAKFFKKKEWLVVIMLFLGIIWSQIRVKTDVYKVFKPEFYDMGSAYEAKSILKMIPRDASVASTNDLGAYLTERKDIIFLTNCIDNTKEYTTDARRCFKITPDYIVANLDSKKPDNLYPDYDRGAILRLFKYYETTGKYTLVKQSGDLYLYKKTD